MTTPESSDVGIVDCLLRDDSRGRETQLAAKVAPINWEVREKLRILSGFFTRSKSTVWGALFVTKHCNLACDYCQSSKRIPTNDLPTEEWRRIIDRLADWGIRATTIVGGEPTTRKDLPELVAHLRSGGIIASLISNFDTLSRSTIDDLASAQLFSLQASIDSLRSRGRGRESWLDLLDYARQVGILPLVSTNITSENVDEIPSLAEEITSRGIMYNCTLYQGVGGAFSVNLDGLKAPSAKLEAALRQVEDIKHRTGLVRTTYRYIHNVNKFYNESLWHCDPTVDAWVNVNADGTLMPCQEYETSVRVLDLSSLQDERWRRVKEDAVSTCRGCYYQCYFEQETSKWYTAVHEAIPILRAWRILSPRGARPRD